MNVVKKELDIKNPLRDEIRTVHRVLRENNYECYLVGGSVRDLLLGFDVYDFDFATNARPEVVSRLFRRVIPTGIKHGTVTVLMKHGTYEITTYRSEGNYTDGRRPEHVTFSDTLQEDVLRRDFTINGLAYDLAAMEIVDYVSGLEDLSEKLIRTIGNPVERFSEDGLRTYRACRFAARLKFKLDDDTFNAISKTLHVAEKVSVERIRDEIMKMLEADIPSIGLEYMRTSGLMAQCMPELDACYGVEQNKYHLFDVYYHSLYSCDSAPADKPLVRLAALLHDIGKVPTRRVGDDGDYTFYNHEVIGTRMVRKLMRRLKFSNGDVFHVTGLISNHMFHYTPEWTDGAVRRFMKKAGLDNLEDLFELRLADRAGNGMREGMPAPIKKLQKRIGKIIDAENAFTVRDLDIDGKILMDEFNLKPGPVIGKVLNELLEKVLDHPELNRRDSLMEMAGEILKDIDHQVTS
jgi:tRNA nucleotidyltransferase (CCA-adding enzyme)